MFLNVCDILLASRKSLALKVVFYDPWGPLCQDGWIHYLWHSERGRPLGPQYVEANCPVTANENINTLSLYPSLPVDIWVVDSGSEGKLWGLEGVVWRMHIII